MLALKTEGGGHEPAGARGPSKRERDENSSLLEPPEGAQPCQHLDFSPAGPTLDF